MAKRSGSYPAKTAVRGPETASARAVRITPAPRRRTMLLRKRLWSSFRFRAPKWKPTRGAAPMA